MEVRLRSAIQGSAPLRQWRNDRAREAQERIGRLAGEWHITLREDAR